MNAKQIKKAVDIGTLIKHYPENCTPITIHSFIYNGFRYGWSSDLKHFIRK